MSAGVALRRIRLAIALFMGGLVLSGVTAFPLVHESALLLRVAARVGTDSALYRWITEVHTGLNATAAAYPFLAYGTDWLAFAHLVLALAFIGPWRDPVRNRWVLEFGLLACAGVIPLALIAGAVRGIPLWWRLLDCSFGVVGALPLLYALRLLPLLESTTGAHHAER